MDIKIADIALPQQRAVEMLRDYPVTTLERYDARAPGPETAWRSFDEDDLAAARVIEPRVLAREPVRRALLEAELPWADVPDRDLDIAQVEPGSQEYDQLSRFYGVLVDIPGVGPAVASKMMYLRWPAATPILDSVVDGLYRQRARARFLELRDAGRLPAVVKQRSWTRMSLFVFRDDVLANRVNGSFTALRDRVADEKVGGLIAAVPDCRLLDILAWSAGRRGVA